MQPSPANSSTHRFLWALLLLVATAIAYFPTTQCSFIWDDDDYVTNNPTLRDANGLKRIWLDPAATPQYYPLVHTTFWLEYQSWGLNATGYHITNFVIHAFNAILLWRCLLALSVPGAWLAALVFAVHPVHVESVAWITERKNVLSGLFYLLALLSFLRYWDFTKPIQSDEPRDFHVHPRLWFALMNLCFIAALLSKTVTATLPAVLLVLIWWKQGHVPVRRCLSLVPMFVIGIGFGLMTVWLEKFQVGASGIDWDLSFVERCLIAGRALWFYAGKLIWPSNLIFTYPRWDIDASQAWQFLFPVAAIAVMMSLWFFRKKLGRGPLAAVLIFAGTLFPALGFLDVYPMRFSFVADHFQYLASIPLIALAVALATQFAERYFTDTPSLGFFAAMGVALTLMGLTWQQTKIYEGLEPLWRDTIARNPASFMAHNNLGALLNRRGDYEEAEKHIRQAMTLKPGFVDAVVNLGKAREGQGDLEGAMKYYRQATELSPALATAWNSLGAMYGAKGDMQTAESHFKEATRLNPGYASARMNLGLLYLSTGQLAEAVSNLKAAVDLQPDSTVARESLVQALVGIGKFDEAETELKVMLQDRPEDIGLIGSLGIVAAKQEKYRAAIEYFERILELFPNEPNAISQLVLLYREVGEADRAEEYAKLYERLPQ